MIRILFLGTPAFAAPSLEKLLSWDKGQVVGVVTQPDRPSGRGNKLHAPPIKELALKHNIAVLQPERLSKSPETVSQMQALKPDVLVTVAFGQILKKEVLELARWGVVNVHGSLLPKYRGPAPINWAIINGDSKTGVTTMYSDKGVDTGLMLLKKEIAISPNMTAEELSSEMSYVGANLLIETLEGIISKSISAQPQDDSQASPAPFLNKEMSKIDWTLSAQEIHNRIRGLVPWPGTYTTFEGTPLKICSSAVASLVDSPLPCPSDPPGTVVSVNPLLIACGDGSLLEVLAVQPASRAKLKAKDWANGIHLAPRVALGK